VILENGLNQPIAPQAFAETAPLFFNGYFVPRQGIQMETQFQTYAQLYQRQPWVATVVDILAKSIARLEIKVWDTAPATGNILKPHKGDGATAYAKLMASPCPTMFPYEFRMWMASTFLLYGEVYLIKIFDDSGRRIVGLLPMHPSLVQIFRNQLGEITYRFMGQPNELLSEEQVVPIRNYNPETPMRGLSRLEALRSTLFNEDASRRAFTKFWQNNLRPSAVMHVDGKLNPEAKQRLREDLNMMYSGAENAGKAVVLENGSKLEQWQLGAEEMQYIDSRKLSREEVCARFDLTPTAAHILDHATFSNVTENLRGVYRDSVCPILEFFESALNHHVGSYFNGQLEAKFDTRQVMRGDFVQRAQAHVQLVQAGIEMPSEARPEFDLGDAGPVAAKLYANQALQPLGTLNQSSADKQPGDDQSDNAVSTTAEGGGAGPSAAKKYALDIKSLMGRGKSLAESVRLLLERNPDDIVAIHAAYQFYAGQKQLEAAS
jgi:HK97 family phage portal protein